MTKQTIEKVLALAGAKEEIEKYLAIVQRSEKADVVLFDVVNHEEHIQQWIRGEKSEIVLDALEKGLRAKLKDVSDQLDLL